MISYDGTSSASIVQFMETNFQTSSDLKSMVLLFESVVADGDLVWRVCMKNGNEGVRMTFKTDLWTLGSYRTIIPHTHQSQTARVSDSFGRYWINPE